MKYYLNKIEDIENQYKILENEIFSKSSTESEGCLTLHTELYSEINIKTSII